MYIWYQCWSYYILSYLCESSATAVSLFLGLIVYPSVGPLLVPLNQQLSCFAKTKQHSLLIYLASYSYSCCWVCYQKREIYIWTSNLYSVEVKAGTSLIATWVSGVQNYWRTTEAFPQKEPILLLTLQSSEVLALCCIVWNGGRLDHQIKQTGEKQPTFYNSQRLYIYWLSLRFFAMLQKAKAAKSR